MSAKNLPTLPAHGLLAPLPDGATPSDAPALPAGLVGDPHAAAAGLFVGIVTDRAAGRLHIGLDQPAADALGTLVDNVVCSDLAQDPDSYGISRDDADDLLAVARAIDGPLLRLFGFQGDHPGGQFGDDPAAAARGLGVSVGTDQATGRAIITLDRAAAAAFDLVLDQLDDDDTGQPDHIAQPMIRVKYAIAAGLTQIARY
jgi:hypothetical protein